MQGGQHRGQAGPEGELALGIAGMVTRVCVFVASLCSLNVANALFMICSLVSRVWKKVLRGEELLVGQSLWRSRATRKEATKLMQQE